MQQNPSSSAGINLDPAAMNTYATAMDQVATGLTAAAATLTDLSPADQLRTDLGVVGAEFAAELDAALAEHADTLTTGAHMVGEYRRVLRDYTRIAVDGDHDIAAALNRAGGQL
ncbi:hypothetical protein ACFQZZ_33305 [Nocardia sp. GCM10030253]|uniref:hypothetical protein n=1 Tax=Nocardia sp. GCM10030253 TaxID=3273404 RepID=UPI00364235F2